MSPRHQLLDQLRSLAERLEELAVVAELMGDDTGSLDLREQAARHREEAMSLLDHE